MVVAYGVYVFWVLHNYIQAALIKNGWGEDVQTEVLTLNKERNTYL